MNVRLLVAEDLCHLIIPERSVVREHLDVASDEGLSLFEGWFLVGAVDELSESSGRVSHG